MGYVVGIFEAIIYLLFVAYSIYITITSYENKKKLQHENKIIKNPPNASSMIVSKAVLILSLPSIILMFTPLSKEDKNGIFVLFAIFLFLMYLGFKSLESSNGDYYIDNAGIHFVRNEKLNIKYEEIISSKWLDYSHINGAYTTTILLVKGKRIKLYNLSKKRYLQYISNKNIFIPKHEAVRSIYKKSFSIIVIVLFFMSIISFFVFIRYTSQYGGGGALRETQECSYEQLLNNHEIPHYLVNHGDVTEVSYQVWITALIMEKIVSFLYPIMFLCFIVNMIWENQIFRKRYV